MTAKSRARKFLKKIHKKEKTNGNPRKLDREDSGVSIDENGDGHIGNFEVGGFYVLGNRENREEVCGERCKADHPEGKECQSESSPKVKVLKSRQVSKEVSENIRPSRPKKTESASRSNESSYKIVEHAIHQNIATGIFWCDCDGFKSHNEQDAKYHMMQNSPKQAKKPYIRKEHLTDRPFADNEALKALRDSLPEAEKFNPGKKPRNKENN